MKLAIVLVLASGCAGHVQKLRALQAPLKPEANGTRVGVSVVAKAPEQNTDAKKDGQYPQKPGVTMQVPEQEIDEFLGKLSSACEKTYSAMLRGDSALHTFGSAGVEPTKESCQGLNGSLCTTMAHVIQRTTNQSGRKMRTTVNVEGNGCLPKECISKQDLPVVATFMHSKARESGTIAGEGVELNLHVDCSESGGSVAQSPEAATAEEKEEPAKVEKASEEPTKEKKHEVKEETVKPEQKTEHAKHGEHGEHGQHGEHGKHGEHGEHDKHEEKSEHGKHDAKSSAFGLSAGFVGLYCLFA